MKNRMIFLALLMLSMHTLFGVETQFFTFKGTAGFKDPLKTEGTGVHSKGYLTLVPRIEKIESPSENIVWTAVKAGNVIYAGAGETGKILYFVDGGEKGVLSELGAFCVKALSVDSEGAMYAGGPGGAVYRFSGLTDQKAYLETGELYVWSILFDGNKNCYAGTGPNGRIFMMDRDGKKQLVYDSKEKHILCLAHKDGYLYAGASQKGLVYRVSLPDRKGEVFAELTGGDVVAMFIRDDALYAAVRPGKPAAPALKKMPALKKGPSTPVKSSIYRIPLSGGSPELFFQAPAGTILDAIPMPDGSVAACTDTKGTVYLISSKDSFITTAVSDAGKVLDLFPLKNGFLAATEKKGFICRLQLDGAMNGEYISQIKSIPVIEKWGVAEISSGIPAGGSLSCFLRTGKSKNTEDGWTRWEEIGKGELTGLDAGATYMQLRVLLSSGDDMAKPSLKELKLSYLPVNAPPEIVSFGTVSPKPKPVRTLSVKGPTPVKRPAPVRKPPSGIPLQWIVKDPNNDPLKYTLSCRAETEDAWVLLEENTLSVKLTVNTAFIPDGKYLFRLTASDEDANMKGKGFSVVKETDEFFTVDKTRPEITSIKTEMGEKKLTAACTVKDALSLVSRGFYRINNGKWVPVRPADLLYDEYTEEFAFTVSRDDADPGDALFLRFEDANANTGVVRVILQE